MEKGNMSIQDGFTLPRGRTACREDDVVVDEDLYRLLQLAEKNPQVRAVTLADTKNEGEVEVARGKTAEKAALAAGLKKHDAEKGFKNRVKQVAEPIAKSIVRYLEGCSFEYVLNAVGDSAFVLVEEDVDIPAAGGLSSFSSCGACYATDSQRKHFLYEVEDAVEKIVLQYLRKKLVFKFGDQSFWDIRMPKVSISNIEDRNDCVKVFLQLWSVPEEKKRDKI